MTYRHRHPETFLEPETTDPHTAIRVAREQRQAAAHRVRSTLTALVEHDAKGQLLTEEWALAVHELNEARAHHDEVLATWAHANPTTEGDLPSPTDEDA